MVFNKGKFTYVVKDCPGQPGFYRIVVCAGKFKIMMKSGEQLFFIQV